MLTTAWPPWRERSGRRGWPPSPVDLMTRTVSKIAIRQKADRRPTRPAGCPGWANGARRPDLASRGTLLALTRNKGAPTGLDGCRRRGHPARTPGEDTPRAHLASARGEDTWRAHPASMHHRGPARGAGLRSPGRSATGCSASGRLYDAVGAGVDKGLVAIGEADKIRRAAIGPADL